MEEGRTYQVQPAQPPRRMRQPHDGIVRQVRAVGEAQPRQAREAPHTIVLTLGAASGYVTVGSVSTAMVTILKRETTSPVLTLTSPTAGPVTGAFDVTGTVKENDALSSLTVTLNGQDLGQTPLYEVELPAGSQRLVLKNPGESVEQTVEIEIESGKVNTQKLHL